MFEPARLASSFCAGFDEERREPEGWRPGANGFGDFCRLNSLGANLNDHEVVGPKGEIQGCIS
jgi:hypothetical protein